MSWLDRGRPPTGDDTTRNRYQVRASRGPAIVAVLVAVIFTILATANSGGYRYGASDQAFYVPAVLDRLDPALFPRDGALIGGQARLLLLDDILAALVDWSGLTLEQVFLAGFLLSGTLLGVACWHLARALGLGPWAAAAFVLAMTLRHQVLETGVNTFEGYFHPRVLAFGLGVTAVVALLRQHLLSVAALLGAALLVHPTTAFWFAVWTSVSWLVTRRDRIPAAVAQTLVSAVLIAACAGVAYGSRIGAEALSPMDTAWVDLLGPKRYLFPDEWRATVWMAHGAIAALLLGAYWWRARLGVAQPIEGGTVAGCLALLPLFVGSLPLVAARIPLAVQLQTSRVLWAVELMATLYLVWALAEAPRAWRWKPANVAELVRPWRAIALVAVLAAAAVTRGTYVTWFEQPGGRLVRVALPATAWTSVLDWARRHSLPDAHFLVDPGHAWKYGVAFRIGAARDVLLEEVKDVSMALYSRPMAARVLERVDALQSFARLTPTAVRTMAARFELDYLITEAPLGDPSPMEGQFSVVWRNERFVVWALDDRPQAQGNQAGR